MATTTADTATGSIYDTAYHAVTELLEEFDAKLEEAILAFTPEIETLLERYENHVWMADSADMEPLEGVADAWDQIEMGLQHRTPGDIAEGKQRLEEAVRKLKRELPSLRIYAQRQNV